LPRPSCYQKAVDLLARRAHFRRELAAKLGARGYPEEEIGDALDRLGHQGYVDDRETARQWVDARLARGPEGRGRLTAELARRGADSEVIDEVLAERLPDDDLPLARQAAERWLARRSGPTRPETLARHLERKGFSPRSIWELIDEHRERSPEEGAEEP